MAWSAIREQETLNVLPQGFEVSPAMIFKWEKAFLENVANAFREIHFRGIHMNLT